MSRQRTWFLAFGILAVATCGCRTTKPRVEPAAAAPTAGTGMGSTDAAHSAASHPTRHEPAVDPSDTRATANVSTPGTSSSQSSPVETKSLTTTGGEDLPANPVAVPEPTTPPAVVSHPPEPADTNSRSQVGTLSQHPTESQSSVTGSPSVPGLSRVPGATTGQQNNNTVINDTVKESAARHQRPVTQPVTVPRVTAPQTSSARSPSVSSVKLPLTIAPAAQSNSVVSAKPTMASPPPQTSRSSSVPTPVKLWNRDATPAPVKSVSVSGASLPTIPSTAGTASGSTSPAPVTAAGAIASSNRHADDNVPTVAPLIETPPNNNEWIEYQQAAKQAEQDARTKELETLRRVFYRFLFRDPTVLSAP